LRAGVGNFADPVFRVKDRFLTGITAELGIAQPSVREGLVTDDMEQLQKALGSGLVLDFKTISWGMGAPSNLFGANRYGVGHMGIARLIRLEERKRLWAGHCIAGTRDDKRATLDEIERSAGALLSEWLAEVANECAEKLLSQFFGKGKP